MNDQRASRPTLVFEVAWGAASDQGKVRSHNEDAWLATTRLFLVADGVGGHAAGEVASRAVVDAFTTIGESWLTPEALHSTLEEARRSVLDLTRQGRAPGSTVVGVGLANQGEAGRWLFFNIGDSRAYLLRGGGLEQISVDHSRFQELKDAGYAAAGYVGRNVITNAIGAGIQGPALPDQWLLPAQPGDRILLCSDGLTTEVSDQLIAATLLTYHDPQDAADELVRSALLAGGHDNVTVLVIDARQVSGATEQDRQAVDEDTLGGLDDDDPLVTTLHGDEDLWSFEPTVREQ